METIIEQAKLGCQKSFSIIFERYKQGLTKYIGKIVHDEIELEDLIIEIFGKAFMRIHSYQPEFAFSTWLYKVAYNHTIDSLRKKRISTISINQEIKGCDNLTYVISDKSRNAEQMMMIDERNEELRRTVEKLPKQYRKLIKMRYYEQKSYKEICEELNMCEGTFKSMLHRSHEILRGMEKRA